jgi:hypothetical protein
MSAIALGWVVRMELIETRIKMEVRTYRKGGLSALLILLRGAIILMKRTVRHHTSL